MRFWRTDPLPLRRLSEVDRQGVAACAATEARAETAVCGLNHSGCLMGKHCWMIGLCEGQRYEQLYGLSFTLQLCCL